VPYAKGGYDVGGIDIVFKVAGIGIISIVISLIFEQVGRKDFAWAATVIGAVLVFGVALLRFKELLDEILTVFRLW
jgi:stage III sporulation protein AC